MIKKIHFNSLQSSKLLVTSIMFILSACSTRYGPMIWKGGYSDLKLQDNIYKVTFSANGYTSAETANNYLLYRCSEIAEDEGFKYFKILEDKSRISRQTYTTPARNEVNVNNDGSSSIKTTSGQATTFNKPIGVCTIELTNEKGTDVMYYDAEQLLENLKSHIIRQKRKSN